MVRIYLFTIFFVMLCIQLRSQGCITGTATSYRSIQVVKFYSEITRDSYDLLISLPKDYSPAVPVPVLYLLDPDYYYLQHSLSFDSLVRQHKTADAIIVGIGYGTDFIERAPRVLRDLTPTVLTAATYSEDSMIIPKDEAIAVAGKSDLFIDFLEKELFPEISRKFNIISNDNSVYANAYGGLFLCYALLKKPNLFDHYIISSPLLWWDNMKIVEKTSEKKTLNASIDVIISAGGKEDKKLRESFASYSKAIKNYIPSAEVKFYKNEDSHTVIPLSFRDGLSQIERSK